MAVPDDVKAFFQTIEASRVLAEQLKTHKVAQAKLIDAKIMEVRSWLTQLAKDLQEQTNLMVGVPAHLQSLTAAVFSYDSYLITFGPFLDASMVQAQPYDRQVGGELLQVDQVTEAWARKVTLGFLLRYLKADNIERRV